MFKGITFIVISYWLCSCVVNSKKNEKIVVNVKGQ